MTMLARALTILSLDTTPYARSFDAAATPSIPSQHQMTAPALASPPLATQSHEKMPFENRGRGDAVTLPRCIRYAAMNADETVDGRHHASHYAPCAWQN